MLPQITLLATLLFQSAASEAFASLKAKAEAGDTRAQVQLGLSYASGDGVDVDPRQAVRWFRAAAEKGNVEGEYYLGEMYLTGRGLPPNLSEGARWMRLAAENGDPRGQYNYAALCMDGVGRTKDESEAAKWMRKAADQGLPLGQFGLGVMCAHGKGVTKSAVDAAHWYRKAADQGELAALNNLALLLAETPDPQVRNPKEAVGLAQKAVDAAPGNPTYLDTLASCFFHDGRPGQAAAAERRAMALKPDSDSYKKALAKYESASRAK